MEGHGTLASLVYARLRRDILTGTFRPGERLRIEAMCERYALASSTPLREALNRLAAEELVRREDQRGFRVAPVSLQDLTELTKTRCWITEVALREAIANGDAQWEEAIVLAAHRLSRVPREGAAGYSSFNPDWEQRHRDFHMALIAACGSHWLIDFYAMLMDRDDRYRYLAVQAAPAGPRDVEGEHRAIVEAVLARDVARAVELSNAHIELTAAIIAAAKGQGDAPPLPAAPTAALQEGE